MGRSTANKHFFKDGLILYMYPISRERAHFATVGNLDNRSHWLRIIIYGAFSGHVRLRSCIVSTFDSKRKWQVGAKSGAQFEGDLGEIFALGAEISPYIGLREKWESPKKK